MQVDQLRTYLDDPGAASEWLAGWGLSDPARGHGNLLRIATSGVTLDLVADIARQLGRELPQASDPDMALNNLDQFFTAARNPLGLASLFERDRESLPILVRIFSTSQHLSDLLIQDHESYDLLRMTEGTPVRRETLVEELAAEIMALADEPAVVADLRRFKRRETLRICYGDFVRRQSLEVVTGQISHLADAIVESAVRFARRKLVERWGDPRRPDGRPARFAAIGMGKLGGVELNYSSDIDLIFLYDVDGQTDRSRPQSNREFFDRLARDVVRLLTETTELGTAYRVDLRLRPEGQRGPMVPSLEQALHYYDVYGRTWERQAYLKARPVAGDLDLGREFLSALEPWIYRRYLNLADIAGIKALKRRIEERALREHPDSRNVKTGHGGLRDIEFAIQFLQLLNGAESPEVRTGNTLHAIARLEGVGCLTPPERSILEGSYIFLRRIEHLLQIMFDLQTHTLPVRPDEVKKLAIRLGFRDEPAGAALAGFEAEYAGRTAKNRTILNHLLHDAFPDDAEMEPEVDLVLDPDPPPERVVEVLSRHGFRDVARAHKNLTALATERIRFLSTRRCRHFLASIAPRLLKTIAATPDPDSTLTNLEKVSDSLGGKRVLWELFSFNPPTMRLYVELCAYSPFLSEMLIGNPGMIDELMDSLVLNKLPSVEALAGTLNELCRAAEDVEPILHSFKSTQQLYVGVRDILGKDDIQATTAALSGIAEVCLDQVARIEHERLAARLGEPTVGAPAEESDGPTEPLDVAPHNPNPKSQIPNPGAQSELVILALGKFGGRELNYQSDLDVVFLYEADGPTIHSRRIRGGQTTTNQHFFSELGGRIIKFGTRLGPYGRLYEIDPRLRPTGRSGALATSLDEFARYFASGSGALWERQALTKARIVYGSPETAARAKQVIDEAAFGPPWRGEFADEIRAMRGRLEQAVQPGNIKRGRGGLVDIEFLTQMLQLRHGGEIAVLRQPGTLDALAALRTAGVLERDEAESLIESYRFLRTLEARLRLMNTTARDDLPEDAAELAKLSAVMGFHMAADLLAACDRHRAENRRCFDRHFLAASP